MAIQKQQIQFATTDENHAFIRVIGQGTCSIGPAFKNLIIDLVNRNCPFIAIEFSECPSVDSTFIGILAKVGDLHRDSSNGEPLVISHPNPRVLTSINSLGVSRLFSFRDIEAVDLPDPSSFSEFNDIPPSSPQSLKENVCSTSIEAHTKLCEVNEENNDKFRHVLDFLKADLESLKNPD